MDRGIILNERTKDLILKIELGTLIVIFIIYAIIMLFYYDKLGD